MAKYRNKPVEIDAFQWFNTTKLNDTPDWFREAYNQGRIEFNHDNTITILDISDEYVDYAQLSHEGDYIIRDDEGRIYSRESELFKKIYEPV